MGIVPQAWRVISWVVCHRDGGRHYATGMARNIMSLLPKYGAHRFELVAKYGGCRVIESVG